MTTQPTAALRSALAERRLQIKSLWPGGAASVLARGTTGTGDLLVLSVLFVLTAAFGRPFSKLGLPSQNLYVTEAAIAVTAGLAFWRCGARGIYARLRRTLPLLPLGLFWLAGAIAVVRGLHSYSISGIKPDVGLVEYSVFVPLVAVAVDTRKKIETLVRVLFASGVAATAVFAIVFFFAPHSSIGIDANPLSAIGLYIALFVVLFAARIFHGRVNTRLEWMAGAGGAAALILMSLLVARSIVLALLTTAVVLIALAPRVWRVRAAAVCVAGIAVSLLGALAVQAVGIGPNTGSAPPRKIVLPGVPADDGQKAFTGGTSVNDDGAVGSRSRQLEVRGVAPYFEARADRLVPHRRYTIAFWVKPLAPVVTRGRIGDTSGFGWDAARWTTRPSSTWQRLKRKLVATRSTERLVVFVDSGAGRVRVDSVRIFGRRARATREPDDRPQVLAALTDTFGSSETGNGFYSNERWRLSIWRYQLEQAAKHDPLLGVGFGTPTAFRWKGALFDGRLGKLNDQNDVTAPHNSFVNIAYRMGFVAALALIALIAIALVRVARRLREKPPPDERARLVGLTAFFTFAVIVASFNVVLEGPYMSMFFWTTLTLLLVMPRANADETRDA